MLFSIDHTEQITTVPHEDEFKKWISRLSPVEMHAIKRDLNRRLNREKIVTSSWIPGHNWSGTPYLPIWDKACMRNPDAAAKCFGLILWEVVMEHPEAWAFGRYSRKNIPIEGMTYFRIKKQP